MPGRDPVGARSPAHELLVARLRALADPTRLEMIRMAAESEEVACTTYLERFGVSKSTIS